MSVPPKPESAAVDPAAVRYKVFWRVVPLVLALVRTPTRFYLARFLLGLAEAGFFPGIIAYFTHWFPRAERSRAMAGMVLGVSVSLPLGARLRLAAGTKLGRPGQLLHNRRRADRHAANFKVRETHQREP